MKPKNKLSKQLLLIVGVAFLLVFILIGIVLPKMLLPVAEENIYNYLKEPLKSFDNNTDSKLSYTDVAYIYIYDDQIVATDNLKDIIKIDDLDKLISYTKNEYGKFTYNYKTYYYYTLKNSNITKIALSDDSYIINLRANILSIVFPVVLGTFLIVAFILVAWSTIVVRKIERLKDKIDNIDNSNYNHQIDFYSNDEIKSLAYAIEDMRISLINQEEYRNEMYQNISHDFKTPLAVTKSYIEAVEDGVEDKDNAIKVIKEQTDKLEQKVFSLLYLNKLDYLKDSKIKDIEIVDMKSIVDSEVSKFKYQRKDLEFIVDYDKKSKYYGTVDNWETILDNLLSNFIRYSKSKIKITLKGNKIILYNDGDKIDEKLLDGIFTPFRKGIKGQFGLGLSIVKKTLNLMDYDITINNEKVGVSFIITRSH